MNMKIFLFFSTQNFLIIEINSQGRGGGNLFCFAMVSCSFFLLGIKLSPFGFAVRRISGTKLDKLFLIPHNSIRS